MCSRVWGNRQCSCNSLIVSQGMWLQGEALTACFEAIVHADRSSGEEWVLGTTALYGSKICRPSGPESGQRAIRSRAGPRTHGRKGFTLRDHLRGNVLSSKEESSSTVEMLNTLLGTLFLSLQLPYCAFVVRAISLERGVDGHGFVFPTLAWSVMVGGE